MLNARCFWLTCSQLSVMFKIAKSSDPHPKWACNQFSGQWTTSILYTLAVLFLKLSLYFSRARQTQKQ